MSRETPAGKALTRLEAELDAYHRTLPLWAVPRPQARFAVLAAFDMTMLPLVMRSPLAGTDLFTSQRHKALQDALIYALRLLHNEPPRGEVAPTNDSGIIEAAARFLFHCRDYGTLTDAHVGYNRGLYDVEVDEGRRRVRFVPRPVEGAAPEPTSMLEDLPGERDVVEAAFAAQGQSERAVALLRTIPHRLEGGRVVIEGFDRLAAPEIGEFANRLTAPHDIPLDDGADLGGLTAQEFRRFWGAVARWSLAAMGLYLDAAFAARRQYDHLPTQFVPREDFVTRVAELSGLATSTVTLCLARLTYGSGGIKNPDPYLQPLLCTPTHVAWSPHLIQATKAERNMLKLMARLPALKALADNLIAGRERVVTRRFREVLARHGYQHKGGVRLPGETGEVTRGEIDVLAFHPHVPEEVLVIEVKGVLGVDEVNEVDHATQEMIAGQGQLRDAIAYLKAQPPDRLRALWRQPRWELVRSFYGVVLTPNAQPSSVYSHAELPAVTHETVGRYLFDSDFKSPRRFWQAVVDKRWLRKATVARREYHPLRIGTLTYELPVLVSDTNPLPQGRPAARTGNRKRTVRRP